MRVLRQFFDFYINSSIHVGLSCYALVRMTQYLFHISYQSALGYFIFFGTILGYNFVKYGQLIQQQGQTIGFQLKMIVVLSALSLLICGSLFFTLAYNTQIVSVLFFGLTLLYTLPFFSNQKNARNWAGIKIYVVALCWVGVTLFLPVINSAQTLSDGWYVTAIQRFILIFVLVLIFEIIDLKLDDPHLKTVPQQIGVQRTKQIGVVLMVLFVLLEFLTPDFQLKFFLLKLALAITTILFLLFSNENRSRYYASFWVESIPIIWWLFLMIFS